MEIGSGEFCSRGGGGPRWERSSRGGRWHRHSWRRGRLSGRRMGSQPLVTEEVSHAGHAGGASHRSPSSEMKGQVRVLAH